MSNNARNIRALLMIIAAVAASVVFISFRGYATASSAHESALARFERTQVLAAQRQRLAGTRASIGDAPRPEGDVLRLLQTALADCDLDPEALSQFRFEDAARITDSNYVRITAPCVLSDVTPFQLASFLDTWRSADTLWTVSELVLDRAVHRSGPRSSGSDTTRNRYTARLTIESVYYDAAVSTPSGSGG